MGSSLALNLIIVAVLTALPTHGSASESLLSRASTFLSDLQLPEKLNGVVRCTPPRADWKETPEGHSFTIDLPGLNRDEIDIEILEQNKVLRVSGVRKRDEEQRGETCQRTEVCYGKFVRRFRLPEDVNTDLVRATFENGVLGIYLAKLPDKTVRPKKFIIQRNEL